MISFKTYIFAFWPRFVVDNGHDKWVRRPFFQQQQKGWEQQNRRDVIGQPGLMNIYVCDTQVVITPKPGLVHVMDGLCVAGPQGHPINMISSPL